MSKEQSKTLFYTQGEEEVLKNLDTSVDGLSTAQAKERLDAYGYNELDEGEKRSLLSKFIDQFKDLMIIILLVAAALSVITEGMHGLTDACIILAVVVLNAAFGVYQEGQAELEKYGIDTASYDVIKGWRADASYFYIAKEFVRDNIDIEILEELLSLGGLGIQYCIKTELAYSKLHEIKEAIIRVDYEEFNNKYNHRDIEARKNMRDLVDSDRNKVTNVFSTLL